MRKASITMRLGNFLEITTDGVEVDETANKQNEITSVSGSTTPAYDANGNMTTDQAGLTYVYNAWNRMVEVKNGSTVEETGCNRVSALGQAL